MSKIKSYDPALSTNTFKQFLKSNMETNVIAMSTGVGTGSDEVITISGRRLSFANLSVSDNLSLSVSSIDGPPYIMGPGMSINDLPLLDFKSITKNAEPDQLYSYIVVGG